MRALAAHLCVPGSAGVGSFTTIPQGCDRAWPRLELRGITKHFGPVQALRGPISFLEEGEIHASWARMGREIDADGSRLGLGPSEAGRVLVRGSTQQIRGPLDARRLGIGMVHQHFTSVPALTVAENIGLAAGWAVSPGPLSRRVRELSEQTGLPIDPAARAGRPPGGAEAAAGGA